MPTIEFLIENKKIKVGKFSNLRDAALKNGMDVYVGMDRLPLVNCAGHGLCGKCTMEIVEGMENLTPKTMAEKFQLSGRGEKVRLSCQAEVLGDVCVITNFAPKPSRQ